MPITASVNYHINSTEPQVYYIDVDGITGKMLPPELVLTQVQVKDLRKHELSVEFIHDSITFTSSKTIVNDFIKQPNWQKIYDNELKQLLSKQIHAKDVIIFDHTVRIDDPNSDRKPARNVHSDYSVSGAKQRLIDLLGKEKAKQWENEHYAFVNIWRPIEMPILTTPLGFIRPKSISADDWVNIELVYPGRKGQIMGLTANEKHEWFYLSNMTPDEVAIFNIYDNQGQSAIAHSALDLDEDTQVKMPRKSIESRTLVRY